MRLAFSTLGVPGMPLPQVLRLAADHGFHGVELRTHPEEPVHTGLSPAQRATVAEEFEATGIRPLALAGYPRVAAPGEDGPVLDKTRELLHLARDLGAPFVRVFPGGGDAAPEEADAAAVRRLTALAPSAEDAGVRLLLETHDSHLTGAAVARVLEAVGHDSVGALWDTLHTWRGGEEPEATYDALGPYLGYVQVKDAASADDLTPLPLGDGTLPLTEVIEQLSRAGQEADCWLCWEYEKRWYPSVPGIDPLLPGAADHLRRLLAASA
ncbi:sugar phosphate isomerase/epimerase [Streptomyces sodiiphilus]|uniref:Sugar phosphate isomerase/epimerase n=1 Tax=Streptomyces sodiiphilus TaxID=226217 RepID=A0ABP5A9W1_9ACTN